MALAALEKLKARLGQSGSLNDDLLAELLSTATAMAEQLCGRKLQRVANITEYPTDETLGVSRYARLQRYPIESVTSVKQLYTPATDAQFTAETALTEITDYIVDADAGQLTRNGRAWCLSPRCLQVIYTGGYQDPSEDPIDGAHQPPMDLQNGIIQQAVLLYNTKDNAGIKQIDVGGDRGGAMTMLESKVHPQLKAACQSLRRMSL